MCLKITHTILLLTLFLFSTQIEIAKTQHNKDSIKVIVNWEKNFETALKKAQENNKTIFIYFWTDWCAPCKQLDGIVFSDTLLGAAINQYICLKLNAEKGEGINLRNKYNIGGYPTFLFIDKNEKEIGRIIGTRSNAKYLTLIKNKGITTNK